MISITDAFCVMNSFKTFADVICGYPLSHISSNNSYINTKFARMLFSFTFPKYDYEKKSPRETEAKRKKKKRQGGTPNYWLKKISTNLKNKRNRK